MTNTDNAPIGYDAATLATFNTDTLLGMLLDSTCHWYTAPRTADNMNLTPERVEYLDRLNRIQEEVARRMVRHPDDWNFESDEI